MAENEEEINQQGAVLQGRVQAVPQGRVQGWDQDQAQGD